MPETGIEENHSLPRKEIDNSVIVWKWFLAFEVITILGIAIWKLRIVNDDTFITLRYAYNLIHGFGLVFTPGEHILGITNPLLAMLQALFSIPTVGNVLLGAYLLQYTLMIASIILIHDHFQNRLVTIASIPLLFFNQQTLGYFGNETILILFLSLAALYALKSHRDILFSIVLSLLYLARFDGFIFGIIASIIWGYQRRPISFKKVVLHISLWASLPILWHIFAYIYYGNFFSNSVSSKILFSSQLHLKSYLSMLIENRLPELFIASGTPIQAILFIFGIYFFWRYLRIYLIWFLGITLVYWLIKAPGVFIWYYYTLTFLTILAVSCGVAYLTEKFLSKPILRYIFAAIVVCILIWGVSNKSWERFSWEQQRFQLYQEISQFILPTITHNTYIETNEIGILGYYLNCRILDHHFLVTKQGIGPHRFPDIVQYRSLLQPQYIIINPYRTLRQEELIQFPGYRYLTVVRSPGNTIHIYIFERLR